MVSEEKKSYFIITSAHCHGRHNFFHGDLSCNKAYRNLFSFHTWSCTDEHRWHIVNFD